MVFKVFKLSAQFVIILREGLDLTQSIPPCTGKDYPVHSLMMNRMTLFHQNSGDIGKYTPSAIEISLDRRLRVPCNNFPNLKCILKWAESVSRKGSLKKTRFFGTLVPNIGGWGGWVPNLPRTPPNHPKNRLFLPEFHLLWSQNSRRVSGSRHLGPMEVPLM